MQCMFNISEEEDEPFTEKAKVRELFKRVQHRDLQDTVKALMLQDTGETGEGRIESNDNPVDSVGKVKTSLGDNEQMHV